MKSFALKNLAVSLLALVATSVSFADTFTLSTGETHEGSVYKILEGAVTLSNAAGEKSEYRLADFDNATRAAIDEWAGANKDRVDVYTKWDAMPVIKASVMPQLPEVFHDPAFKGMVSVDLVLNEDGHVISAKIKKSTHEGLEGPSLEAAKTWLFEPAKVAGQPVKAKLRVPFKFTFVPKPEPGPEPAA